jgi:hypothetical protein
VNSGKGNKKLISKARQKKRKFKETIKILILGKDDRPEKTKLSRFLNKILFHFNIMIFVFLRKGQSLYKKGMCERIYDYHFQLKENFDLSMGNDVVHIQMYGAKEFLLKAGTFHLIISFFYFIQNNENNFLTIKKTLTYKI